MDDKIKIDLELAIGDAEKELDQLQKNINELNFQIVKNGKLSKEDAEDLQELEAKQKTLSRATDSLKKSYQDAGEVTKSFRAQCKELQEQLAQLRLEGKEGTEEYQNIASQLGTLRDAYSDAAREANSYANDTRKLSLSIGALKDGIAVYQGLVSAQALFGTQSKESAEVIKQLVAVQGLLNTVNQVYTSLLDRSTIAGKAYAKVQTLLSSAFNSTIVATEGATVATKGFQKALIATGIGAIVVVVGELIAHWEELTEMIGLSDDALLKLKAGFKSFGVAIKNVVLIHIKECVNALETLGKVAVAVFKGNFSEIPDIVKEGVDDAKNIVMEGAEEVKQSYLDNLKELREAKRKEQQELLDKQYQEAEKKLQKQFQKEELERLRNHEEETIAIKTDQYNRLIALQKKYNQDSLQTELDREKAIKDAADKAVAEFESSWSTDSLKGSDKAMLDSYKKLGNESKIKDPFKYFDEDEESEDIPELSGYQQSKFIAKNGTGDTKASKEFNEKVQGVSNKVSEIADSFTELSSIISDSITSAFDVALEATQEALDRIGDEIKESQDTIDGYQQSLDDYKDKLTEASGADSESILANIDATKQAMAEEKKVLEDKQNKEKQLKNQEAELEYKQKKASMTAQMLQTVASTAAAATTTLAQLGVPIGIAPAAVATAMGTASVATIAAQLSKLKPTKFENGGLLQGPAHSQGGIPVGSTGIEVEGGEYIINKKSTKAFLPLLEAINGVGTNGPRFADGGQLPQITPKMPEVIVRVVDINKVSNRIARVQDMM